MPIFCIDLDATCTNMLWGKAIVLLVLADLDDQVFFFVVRIPVDTTKEWKPIHHRHTYFGSELNGSPGFPLNARPQPPLNYVHKTVDNTTSVAVKHFTLPSVLFTAGQDLLPAMRLSLERLEPEEIRMSMASRLRCR